MFSHRKVRQSILWTKVEMSGEASHLCAVELSSLGRHTYGRGHCGWDVGTGPYKRGWDIHSQKLKLRLVVLATEGFAEEQSLCASQQA